MEVEGLLGAWCSLANWNYCVWCSPNCSHCFLVVLSFGPRHGLVLVLGKGHGPTCQHLLPVLLRHSHCWRVDDEVDAGEYEQGTG